MRTALAALSLLVVIALLSPLVTETDDFPLSTQPMFATPRAQFAEFITARAFDSSGIEVELTMAQIAETDDPLVAEESFRDAFREGRVGALCGEVAARVPAVVARVEVVELTHDLDADEVTQVIVLASCTP